MNANQSFCAREIHPPSAPKRGAEVKGVTNGRPPPPYPVNHQHYFYLQRQRALCAAASFGPNFAMPVGVIPYLYYSIQCTTRVSNIPAVSLCFSNPVINATGSPLPPCFRPDQTTTITVVRLHPIAIPIDGIYHHYMPLFLSVSLWCLYTVICRQLYIHSSGLVVSSFVFCQTRKLGAWKSGKRGGPENYCISEVLAAYR